MTEWKKVKLGDIGIIVGGATPSTKNTNFYGGKIAWITPKDLANFNDRYISTGERNITEEGLKSCSAQLMPKGSVLFSSRAPIGYVAIAKNELCTNQGFKSIIPNENTNSLFLYYLLKFNTHKIDAMGSGTTFKEVSASTMRNIEVNVPPLPTQKKIAGVLSCLDAKIELNRRINENLEQQAQAIFKEWFVDNAKSEKEKTIGDYITPKRGKNLLSKDAVFGDVPVVAGGLEPATYHNISNTKSPVLTISSSGANAGFVRLWNIPVWSSDSCFIDSTMSNDVYFWYVLLKLRQQEIYDSQTGSAQPHIYPQHIANLKITELNQELVEKYIKTVTPLFEKIGANQKENATLATIRDTLLPKLMGGELEV